MELKILTEAFTVCKVSDISQVNFTDEYCFVGKTDEELSLVCQTTSTPSSCEEREDGFRGFRIQGVLDFSLIGILAEISTILAEEKIGIFVVSTFNTDYVLVKDKDLDAAIRALADHGYQIAR